MHNVKKATTVNPVEEAINALDEWQPRQEDLESLLALTERSLDEVKALTEYEDTKAQRILAAIAFLAALAGAMFALASRSVGSIEQIVRVFVTNSVDSWLAIAFYVSFATYSLLLAIGAAFVIIAVAPRFHIGWGKKESSRPQSFLFFERILEVSPPRWADAFITSTTANLRRQYIRHSIMETYFVATKIRTKLRWFGIGVWLLISSTCILGGWLLLSVYLIAFSKQVSIGAV